jgi:predicted enzyme related to lactoylglutathione lyase
MGIRVGSIVVNCADLDAMSSFWSQALDLTPGPIVEDGRFQVFGGDRVNVSLQVSQSPVTCRNQMHVDLYTDDQTGEVKRLADLGAAIVRHTADPDDNYVVMSDPEGNEFCVCAL